MNQERENTMLAVLFAAGEPMSRERLASGLELDPETTGRLLDHLRDRLDERDAPFQLLKLGGQYQLATRERFTPAIQRVLNERRNAPLTPAALEVLAAVAYNQPVTRAYVEQVRGVDSSGIVASLVEKGLLEEAGRLELPGRPIAYRTTAHFLRTFGLSALDELPDGLDPGEEPAPPDDLVEGQLGFDQTS